MSSGRAVLGRIDCPTCGETHGMKVTHDKNGEPFGHCLGCAQQLRIGGNPRRVAAFTARYPWAKGGDVPPAPAPAPVVPKTPPPPTKPKATANPFEFLMGGRA